MSDSLGSAGRGIEDLRRCNIRKGYGSIEGKKCRVGFHKLDSFSTVEHHLVPEF